jgi:hypothetical protein
MESIFIAFKRSGDRSPLAPSLLFNDIACLMSLTDSELSGLLYGRVFIDFMKNYTNNLLCRQIIEEEYTMGYVESNLMPDEKVLVKGKRHWILLVAGTFMIIFPLILTSSIFSFMEPWDYRILVMIAFILPFQFHLLSVNTTDRVSGGVWGRRSHTTSEPTLSVSFFKKLIQF